MRDRCQEKETEELRQKCSTLSQERDRDDDVTTKNQKLRRKIDKCKSELADARRDVSTLESQLEQVRQEKVVP